MTGGTIRLENVVPDHFEAALRKLEESGCSILRAADAVTVSGPVRPRPVSVVTRPFPGFPTDMQAQMIAVCAIGEGTSVIEDTIYIDRFTHVPELARMGARIELKGNVAVVKGVDRLAGAQVMATDLRASASLVIAALAARGETLVDRIYHLDRGYESLEQKARGTGRRHRTDTLNAMGTISIALSKGRILEEAAPLLARQASDRRKTPSARANS